MEKIFREYAGKIGAWFLTLLLLLLSATVVSAQKGIEYEPIISGITDKGLRKDLESISKSFQLEDHPPATLNLLKYRAREDIPLLKKALRAFGYYSAQIKVDIDVKAEPIRVTFHVAPGPLYRLGSTQIEIVGKNKHRVARLPTPADLGLSKGNPATAKSVMNAQEKLLMQIKKQGFPFPEVEERQVIVDHGSQSMTAIFRIDPGPLAYFGETTISGLRSVDEQYVLAKIPWKTGEKFNPDLLAEFQNNLTTTGLFSVVRTTYPDHVGPGGELPMTIEVTERKHRSIKAGVSYSTDEGIGGKLIWENRNLWHHGERLYLGIVASEIDLSVEANLRVPEFLHKDQSLNFNLKPSNETTDAYDSQIVQGTVFVERKIGEHLSVGAGLGFRQSRVDQLDEKNNFSLAFLPAHMDWVTTDSLLNPTRGHKLNVRLAPYWDVAQTGLQFTKGWLFYSHYFKLFEHPYVLFAGRITTGSIAGADLLSVPADLRFYAGGGGSIRGYPYQSVGPLDHGDPIGGRSLLEFSAEFRFKVTESIGFVTFVDGGNAYEANYPDFSDPIRWGAGAGLRYYTGIGPLRLDVAVPINPPSNVNDSFQIYVSIGQAF